uniref:Protein kinase domain-containing protein n=1 Tax=Glossina brevipalpis TaxID=37001 RepID=A0A1A9W5E7_9MUSC
MFHFHQSSFSQMLMSDDISTSILLCKNLHIIFATCVCRFWISSFASIKACFAVSKSSSNPLNAAFTSDTVTQVHTKCIVLDNEKVKLSHYTLLRVLDAGGYDKVFMVRKNGGDDDKKLYAMKVLKKAAVQTKKYAEYIANERQIHVKI